MLSASSPTLPVPRSGRPPKSSRGLILTALLLALGVAGIAPAAHAAAPPRSVPSGLVTTGALADNDPFVGLWQRGNEIVDVLAAGEARWVGSGVACRVGEVHSKNFAKVAEGQYTVDNGNFSQDSCTAESFTPGFRLDVAGDVLSLPGSGLSWNRRPGTGLAPTDPVIGKWRSPDGNIVNEVRPDGTVRLVTGLACRIGQLDSYDVTAVTAGTYTVRNGNFATGACAAGSFSEGYTLTVAADGLRPGGGGQPWTRVADQATETKDSIVVIHQNIGGHWVPCGLVIKDKSTEIQKLFTTLGIAQPGLTAMGAEEAAGLDKVILQDNADNVLNKVLYRPLFEAAQQAAAGPLGVTVPVAIDDDATGNFRAACVRRS